MKRITDDQIEIWRRAFHDSHDHPFEAAMLELQRLRRVETASKAWLALTDWYETTPMVVNTRTELEAALTEEE